MIIATFGPTTGWSGKTIDYDNGLFTLEGHGPISSVDVLAYDQQGHLTWAYDGLQAWVQQLAAGQGAPPVALQPVAPQTGAQPPRRKGSALKIVLIVVGALVGLLIVAVVLGVALGGGSESSSGSTAANTPAATHPATPSPTAPPSTHAPTQPATPTPKPTQASLASRVAAAIHVRTDYTSFSIPPPKVVDAGKAWGGGRIVEITYYVPGDDIFNENAFVDGVSPATVDVMAGAFSQPEVTIVDVNWKTDFTDQYGKSVRDAAFQIRWKRKTFKKVDVNGLFDRVATSPEDLYLISDWYSIHPAIWKATHLKDQIPMIVGN
jgi:hypothetical protein